MAALATGYRSALYGSVALRLRVLALIAICLAEQLVVVDNTLVNVALPAMAVELQARMSGLQWIVDAYTLAFAGLLLALGHLGDRYGRRRVMIIGLAGVAVMSAVGALSTSLPEVIVARAGMGVFAAAVFPATLALIIGLFPGGRGRAAAIAVWSAMAGIAVATGPLAGGFLLRYFSWHAVFWINVPIALIAVTAVLLMVPESRAEHTGRLDVAGVVLSLIAVITLVWTIIEAPKQGWLSSRSVAGYAIAAILLVVYVVWELRVESPVLNVRLLGIRRFSVPALAITVSYFCAFGFTFLITQYFQGVREYSALEFGIRSLPFAAAVGVGAAVGTMVARRIGTTATVIAGLVLLAAGMYAAGRIAVDSSYLGLILTTMLLMGVGFGAVQGPATESIMGSVPLAQAGAGSAVNDTTREVGGALGVAVLGSILTSAYTARVGARIDAVPGTLMNSAQKSIARESPISVLEMAKAPVGPFLAKPKADLIDAMKAAAVAGSQTASHIAVGALLGCAALVAVLLPWRPERASPGRSDRQSAQQAIQEKA
ncbi:MFS transporter [Nocardia sp. NPDC088792]|uniref:MFS transporter n=1 Tax=Nocardia sp. NPDC088792 TaxID=3364332 RepID=UPI00382E1442